jgi:serine protease AprX
MTVSKPPVPVRNVVFALNSARLRNVIAILGLLTVSMPLLAQDTVRFVRLHLRDKGTPRRTLSPGDPLYGAASAHLTSRALARRAKVLPASALVSTDDLPVHAPYLAAITATGATIVQTSRWMNTSMVRADSVTIEALRRLPFLDSVDVVRALPRAGAPFGKPSFVEKMEQVVDLPLAPEPSDCFADYHGLADFQNRFMGLDEAHRMGFAGEGVLIGVLDAGFDWRTHASLRSVDVVAEYDFIHGNANTANEAEDSLAVGSQEEHGTMVLSLIGGRPDLLVGGSIDQERAFVLGQRRYVVGGAPFASFILAKTEDLRYERHVEQDNFVAGLEWLESRGVDITNTSLGYTTFDEPERSHAHSELDGHTAFASRAVNHAVALGVVCVVAAGNEGRPGQFMYVSVPGEADSAIAAAAVDSSGRVAPFSSRGFSDRLPRKPDVAAFGVGNWAAHPANDEHHIRSQGTSFAAPMTTAVAAVLLSAAPELRPWEVRDILQRSGTRADDPDTAIGHGIVHAGRALRLLGRERGIVGMPRAGVEPRCFDVVAYVATATGSNALTDTAITARLELPDGTVYTRTGTQPREGFGRWSFPVGWNDPRLHSGDSATLTFLDARSGAVLGQTRIALVGNETRTQSVACARPSLANDGGGLDPDSGINHPSSVEVYPNPFTALARLSFSIGEDAVVTLSVHNSIGEEVARLYDGAPLSAGCHTPIFDARGLPVGSYYVRLAVGEAVGTGEMIYIP